MEEKEAEKAHHWGQVMEEGIRDRWLCCASRKSSSCRMEWW